MEWVRTFEYTAPIDEVWRAFYETDEPQVWNNPIKGDAYISAGATEVEVTEVEPGHAVRWSESEGDDRIEMTVTLEAIEGSTRLTITRSGFGSGDAWTDKHSARLLGWDDALHDLGVFLESGLVMRRIHEWKSAFAVSLIEVPGGLRAGATLEGGFAAQAGLRPGDLVIRIAGVPVFRRSDQWFVQRMYRPGDIVSIDYVRDGEELSGEAPMSPLTMWSGG
jgi:uncharacterized protein YndB with AHSA1/START domain